MTDGQEVTSYDPNIQWESDGNEELAKPVIPMVTIVQPTSQKQGAEKHGGEFYHSDLDAYTPVLECVILRRIENRALFEEGNGKPVCRSDDGQKPVPDMPVWDGRDFLQLKAGREAIRHGEPTRCGNCQFSQWYGERDNQSPPTCKLSYNLLVVRSDDSIAQFRFHGTSLKPYTEWVKKNLAPSQRNPRGLPSFSKAVTFGTEIKTRGQSNKWAELTITSTPLSQEEALHYNAMRQELGMMATAHTLDDDSLPFDD